MKFLFSILIISFLFCNTSQSQQQTKYVGSKNSNKYHKTTCRFAKSISPSNLIEFTSIKEAEEAGYIPCKVCKPNSINGDSNNNTTSKKSLIKKTKSNNSSGRCQAITKKGTQCKRNAEPGSIYCWQHQK